MEIQVSCQLSMDKSRLLQLLEGGGASARVGCKAPQFDVPAHIRGELTRVRLEDLLGKWVILFFYPGDFTFVWPTELSAVAEKYGEFKSMGAEILAISIDTVFSHKVWNEGELAGLVEGGLPYPMLADPAGKLGRIYGVFDEEGCVNLRGRFIIDPDGVLKAAEILDSSVGRNIDEILRQLAALQHVRQSGGVHVCPVNWAFGDLDMTPGPDEVGHAGEHWKSELEE